MFSFFSVWFLSIFIDYHKKRNFDQIIDLKNVGGVKNQTNEKNESKIRKSDRKMKNYFPPKF